MRWNTPQADSSSGFDRHSLLIDLSTDCSVGCMLCRLFALPVDSSFGTCFCRRLVPAR